MTTARRVIAFSSALFLLPLMVIAAVSAGSPSASASGGSLFHALSGFKPSVAANANSAPASYRVYRADLAGLRTQLGSGPTTLSIPDPAGTATVFAVHEDSVMEPAMQAAHPDIRTYAGATADGTTIRLDVTPLGFHAMVVRPDGVDWYVEPVTRAVGEDRVYSFAGAQAGQGPPLVEQQVKGAAANAYADASAGPGAGANFSTPGGVVTQRTYRLALTTDFNYAKYIVTNVTDHATDDPLVFAAKTTLVNRIDEVYNDDVAYKFVMINGTDTKLDFLTQAEFSGPDGPCGADACFPGATGTNFDCSTVLERNDFVLGQIMGADSYDIGHVGVGVNGGGVAGLGVVGSDIKATGCTGIPTPVGDFYAIDYVAHEMGHQMGGNHTFDGPEGNCGPGNRNPSTSVEPGSGSTIMAYAGICDTDDLQPHSDPYFSFESIDEFEATTAEARSPLSESQSVATTGLSNGEQLTISCSGCGTQNVTFTGNGATDAANLSSAVSMVSGSTATVTGYDGANLPSANGFTATWSDNADHPTLTVTGPFTALVGTLVQGGPQTNGGTLSMTTDHSPVVTAPADKTIPIRTPFTLTGSATDQDAGDVLTYDWEQTDTGGASGTGLVNNVKTDGPLFRVFGQYAPVDANGTLQYHSPGENLAGTDPSRTFPDLAQVLAGNTNAATGSCPTAGSAPVAIPIVECFSEFLPTAAYLGTGGARVLHFRLTARDNYTHGGGTHPGGVSWANMALTVDPTAGPLEVTSRAIAGSPASGAENVTWNVNGTNGASLAPNVSISLTTDGGQTWTTLLTSTPNDGSEQVTLPNITTSTARIRVAAVGNYFFDVNDANFSITPASPSQVLSSVSAKAKPKKIHQGRGFRVKSAVTALGASGVVPSGTVQVYRGSKLLGTGTLLNGKVTIKVSKRKARKLHLGRNKLTVEYLGSATVAPSNTETVIKVKRRDRH